MSRFYLSRKFACTGPSGITHLYHRGWTSVSVCVGEGGGGGIEIHFRESREAKLFDYDR